MRTWLILVVRHSIRDFTTVVAINKIEALKCARELFPEPDTHIQAIDLVRYQITLEI